jgi:hypothetical protein
MDAIRNRTAPIVNGNSAGQTRFSVGPRTFAAIVKNFVGGIYPTCGRRGRRPAGRRAAGAAGARLGGAAGAAGVRLGGAAGAAGVRLGGERQARQASAWEARQARQASGWEARDRRGRRPPGRRGRRGKGARLGGERQARRGAPCRPAGQYRGTCGAVSPGGAVEIRFFVIATNRVGPSLARPRNSTGGVVITGTNGVTHCWRFGGQPYEQETSAGVAPHGQ